MARSLSSLSGGWVAGACVGYNYKICSCRPHTLRAVFSSRHCTLRQPRRLAERARRSAYVRISVTIARLSQVVLSGAPKKRARTAYSWDSMQYMELTLITRFSLCH